MRVKRKLNDQTIIYIILLHENSPIKFPRDRLNHSMTAEDTEMLTSAI